MKKNFILFFCFLFFKTISFSQAFEIRLQNPSGNTLSVDVRCTTGPAPTTGDVLADLTFAIKWQDSYNVDLNNPTGSYNVIKSGVETQSGSFEYQIYQLSVPLTFPVDWVVGTWVTVANVTIGLPGAEPTGDFEIAETGFDPSANPNININAVDDYAPSINGAALGVILPLELLRFDANADNSVVQLNWSTANETNFSHFDLERSENGREFKAITEIKGKGGNDINEYDFVDEQVKSGITYYYRLKMNDDDSKFEYSPIAQARIEGDGFVVVSVSPNPTNRFVNVQYEAEEDAEMLIRLFDMNGRVLSVSDITITKGFNTATLDISNYPAGTYLLSVKSGAHQVNQKIVKE